MKRKTCWVRRLTFLLVVCMLFSFISFPYTSLEAGQVPDDPYIFSPGLPYEPGLEISTLTPTLYWTDVPEADYYALAISKYPYGPENVFYNPQYITGTTHTVPSGVLQPGEKYRWNMQAGNAAGWSLISNTLYFQTPGTVSARIDNWSVSPRTISSGQNVTLSMTFTNTGTSSYTFLAGASLWAPDGTIIDFERYVTLSPGSSTSVTWSRTLYMVGSWDVQFAVWREKPFTAENLLHKQPPTKAVGYVTVTESNQVPSAPTALSPGSTSAPGPEISTISPTMSWTAVSGADRYALAISRYPYGSANIIYNPQNLTGTSHTVPSGVLEPGEKYRWNMQAGNAAGWSSISNTLYFNTGYVEEEITGIIEIFISLFDMETGDMIEDSEAEFWVAIDGPEIMEIYTYILANTGEAFINLPFGDYYLYVPIPEGYSQTEYDNQVTITEYDPHIFVWIEFFRESDLDEPPYDVEAGRIILTEALEITPTDPYIVKDALTATFKVENKGDAAITLDKLLLGGRFNGGELPDDGGFPDFPAETVTLQPGNGDTPESTFEYEYTYTLPEPGNYEFFIAYYIENPTDAEKEFLDENNWNTAIELGEGLTDTDRTRRITVITFAEPYISSITPSSGAIGDVVTIEGLGFSSLAPDIRVRFGILGHLKEFAEILSLDIEALPNQITVRAPALDLRWLDKHVDVYLSSGFFGPNSNTVQFTYKKPTLDEIYPLSGLPGWGVTLTGEHFGDGESGQPYLINFGAEKLRSSSESVNWGNDQIKIEAPASLGLGGSDEAFLINALSFAITWGNTGAIEAFAKLIGVEFLGWVLPSSYYEIPVSDEYDEPFWLQRSRSILAELVPGVDITLGGDLKVPVNVLTPIGESEARYFTFTRTPDWSHIDAYWEPVSPEAIILIESPGELRIYDSQGRITGMVESEAKQEIPNSLNMENIVYIFNATDSYVYEIVGTDEGTYGIKTAFLREGEVETFALSDVPISTNTKHRYTIDWEALAQNYLGVTIQIDAEGDGEFEETIVTGLPHVPSNPLPADQTINVSPITQLEWQAGDSDPEKELTYEIYFGPDETPDLMDTIGPYSAEQDMLTYNPGILELNTTYYWRVVARDNYGLTVEGPVWTFTTGSEMPDPGEVSAVIIDTTDSLTIEAGSGDTVTFTAEARDAFGNLITDDVEDFTWVNADAGVFDEAEYGWGTYDVTAIYEDVTSEIITVTVQDTIKPTITIDDMTYYDGDEIYLGYIATDYGKTVEYTKEDNGSGFAPDGELLVNDSESIPTSVAGFDLEHELSVTDRAGNATTIIFTYHVLSLDDLIDLLEPVAEEDNRFRRNRTVPIKLQIYEDREAVQMSTDDLTFELKLYQVTNGIREEREVQSTRHQGDLDEAEFRLSEDGYQYIFNLNLRGLQTGHYEIDIHIKDGDGIVGTIEFEIW